MKKGLFNLFSFKIIFPLFKKKSGKPNLTLNTYFIIQSLSRDEKIYKILIWKYDILHACIMSKG